MMTHWLGTPKFLISFSYFSFFMHFFAFASEPMSEKCWKTATLCLRGGSSAVESLSLSKGFKGRQEDHDGDLKFSQERPQAHDIYCQDEKLSTKASQKISDSVLYTSFQTPSKQHSSYGLRLTPRAQQREREADASPTKIEGASSLTESDSIATPKPASHLQYVASTPPLKSNFPLMRKMPAQSLFPTQDRLRSRSSPYFRTPVPSQQSELFAKSNRRHDSDYEWLDGTDEQASKDLIQVSLHQKKQLDQIMSIAEKQKICPGKLRLERPLQRIALGKPKEIRKVQFQETVSMPGTQRHEYKGAHVKPVSALPCFADANTEKVLETSEDLADGETQMTHVQDELSGIGDLASAMATPKESEFESFPDTQPCDASQGEELSGFAFQAPQQADQFRSGALKAKEDDLISSLQNSADKLRAALFDMDAHNDTIMTQDTSSNLRPSGVQVYPHVPADSEPMPKMETMPLAEAELYGFHLTTFAKSSWILKHVAKNLITLVSVSGIIITIPTVFAAALWKACTEMDSQIQVTGKILAIVSLMSVNIAAAASVAILYRMYSSSLT